MPKHFKKQSDISLCRLKNKSLEQSKFTTRRNSHSSDNKEQRNDVQEYMKSKKHKFVSFHTLNAIKNRDRITCMTPRANETQSHFKDRYNIATTRNRSFENGAMHRRRLKIHSQRGIKETKNLPSVQVKGKLYKLSSLISENRDYKHLNKSQLK